MLNVPTGQFAEATAVWVGCILAFVLVVLLRRGWIRRAKARRTSGRPAGDRVGTTRAIAVGRGAPVEDGP